jgi:hypothetical protein
MLTWAAIKHIPTGNVVIGKRHHNCFAEFWLKYPELKIIATKKELVQGFIDEDGNFLTRHEAARHAFECGQIEKEQTTLFSEDLW